MGSTCQGKSEPGSTAPSPEARAAMLSWRGRLVLLSVQLALVEPAFCAGGGTLTENRPFIQFSTTSGPPLELAVLHRSSSWTRCGSGHRWRGLQCLPPLKRAHVRGKQVIQEAYRVVRHPFSKRGITVGGREAASPERSKIRK